MKEKRLISKLYVDYFKRQAPDNWEELRNSLPEQNFSSVAIKKNYPKKKFLAVASILFSLIGISAVIVLKNISVPYEGAPEVVKDVYSTAFPSPVMHLPMIPAEPFMVRYDGKLYIANTPFNSRTTGEPEKKIGHFKNINEDLPAYSVKGLDTSKSICIKTNWEENRSEYYKYDYVCSDTLKIQGRIYHFIGSSGFSNITDIQTLSSISKVDGSYVNYYIDWIFLYSNPAVNGIVQKLLDKEIYKIPTGGTVYSIDEINPTEAVFLNINDNWFFVRKVKGYSGKTVSDVMKDKGLQFNGPVH